MAMSSGFALFVGLFVFVVVTQLLRLPAALRRVLRSVDLAEEPQSRG
jgi:hypothetical protein